MKRTGSAVWQGSLGDGNGTVSTQSGALDATPYSFKSRFEDESGRAGTNPEELLGAAHAGCFAMQLSHFLAEAGHPPEKLDAKAVVTVEEADGGFAITSSRLTLRASVPGMSEDAFLEQAEKAKATCPLSKVIAAEITLDAALI